METKLVVVTVHTRQERRIWRRVHAGSVWVLVGLFALMGVVHVAMTGLFYVGVLERGVGWAFGTELPVWVITGMDLAAAVLMLGGYRISGHRPGIGLLLTVAASVLMLGRAAWMVFVPVVIVVVLVASVASVVRRPLSG